MLSAQAPFPGYVLAIVARRRTLVIGSQTFHYTAGELRGGDPQAGTDLFSQRRGYWEIRARMPAPADGSSDIGFWPGADKVIPHGEAIDNGDGTQTVEVRSATPLRPEAPGQFLRLAVSQVM